MEAFEINVSEIEELQTYKYTDALDKIFTKARRTIVGGEIVILVRRYADGRSEKFDEITTAEDLDAYRKQVYKYLV
jgi:hypothetical protein